MTAIFYPDCDSTSDNGSFTVEARSPHNGTIHHRDGRAASDDEFGYMYRQHQREFRYQLLDNNRSVVVWERWQQRQEDSPHEIAVADNGWAIIRTHGFRPEIIAVAPTGQDILRLRLAGPGGEYDKLDVNGTVPTLEWHPEHLGFSTAGLFWAGHSWRYFFQRGDHSYFAWRCWWGQRLLVDLNNAAIVPDDNQLGIAAEKYSVMSLLRGLSPKMDEVRLLLAPGTEREPHPILERLRRATSALQLVGAHRIRECIPFLREWEDIDAPSFSMGSNGLSGGWWLETQLFRPIVHHSLKLLGEEPRGFPTYHFTNYGNNTRDRFPLPRCIPDRQARIGTIGMGVSAGSVLRLLGSPDFVQPHAEAAGTPEWRAREYWEYDFKTGDGWVTWRLTWEEQKQRRGKLVAITKIAPYWLKSAERQAEFLRM